VETFGNGEGCIRKLDSFKSTNAKSAVRLLQDPQKNLW